MATTERIWSDEAIPPGEVLAETLEARGMSQAELARRAGRPAQAINEIVTGEKEITPETAIQLEHVLGTPAHVWVRLEADYRYTLARLEEGKRLQQGVHEARKYPCRDMAKLGWLPKPGKPADVARKLLEFFGVASLQNVPKSLPAAFRRSERVAVSSEALAAWLRQGELEARAIPVAPFSEKTLRESLAEMRILTRQTPDVFEPRLRALLARCGIAFVVVPHLPKTGAHGATRWIGDTALMQVSLRYRWADIFWFTVFHEIGHLLLHGRRDTFIEFEGHSRNAAETAADSLAADTLIPPDQYSRFRRSLQGRPVTGSDVLSFSRHLGVAEGIVVGRLQHDRVLPPTHLNGLRVRFEWLGAVQGVSHRADSRGE